MKTNQRNANSCSRKMAKVGDNKFVFLVISKFPHSNIPLLNHLLFLEYGQVLKMLGNGRLEAMCFDGIKRLCHIRGKLRKKVC